MNRSNQSGVRNGVLECWSKGRKRTDLARVLPHDSMQVVDFPHLAMVSQAKLGSNMGKPRKNHRDTETQSCEGNGNYETNRALKCA
jgi:hypothetical protein